MPRTPTTDDQKRLRGTLRPCRTRGESVAVGPISGPPAHMPDDAASIWRELVEAAPDGILAASDTFLVEVAASLIAKHRAGKLSAAELGQLRHALADLGLTPAGRLRLPATKPKTPNEFAEFLK
ncbi:MAG: hypothetical protein KIT00_05445 [Rhodospirillales bacterium]|nr:hypothetical protein [Rhodospirillales bacterium]